MINIKLKYLILYLIKFLKFIIIQIDYLYIKMSEIKTDLKFIGKLIIIVKITETIIFLKIIH